MSMSLTPARPADTGTRQLTCAIPAILTEKFLGDHTTARQSDPAANPAYRPELDATYSNTCARAIAAALDFPADNNVLCHGPIDYFIRRCIKTLALNPDMDETMRQHIETCLVCALLGRNQFGATHIYFA